MNRTLSTANMADLLSRAPSVWDNYDPAIDEPRTPRCEFADPTKVSIEHMNFVIELRIMEGLANGELFILVENPEQCKEVRNLLSHCDAA